MIGSPLIPRLVGQLTIRARWVVGTSLLVAAHSLAAYAYFPAQLEHQAGSSLAAKGLSTAEVTAYAASPALVFDDPATAAEALMGAWRTDDFSYIVVTGVRGEILASYGLDDSASPRLLDVHLSYQDCALCAVQIALEEGNVLRIGVPVMDVREQEVGRLYLGVDLHGLRADLRSMRVRIGLLCLSLLVAGVLGAYLLSSAVTCPLARIVRTVAEITEGDLSQRAPVSSHDEVGQLASAFNEMVSRLESARRDLETMNESLEEMVEARTRDLRSEMEQRQKLQEQLRQSQKMEAIGRLAGGIAHDFNNLLTAILGYADLILLDGSIEADDRESVTEISKAAQRAASLTQQLLAFGRRQVLRPEPLVPGESFLDMENMLQRLIGEDILLRIHSDPEAAEVVFDHTQLQQVVMNLVVNARDAMPAGGTLTVNVESLDSEHAPEDWVRESTGRVVRISVIDSGTGMDKATLKQIFEPFFTTKEIGKGTGLGLATVYGIVRQSGGHILVRSEPGVGTRFDIYLEEASATVKESPPALGVT